MAVSTMVKEKLIASHIRNILKETMGEDYMTQIAKRQMLCKDDELICSLCSIENLIHVKIFKDMEE